MLRDKIEAIIKNAVGSVGLVEKTFEVVVTENDRQMNVTIDFLGDRCGDDFFQPRRDEEDDDCPIFIGRRQILDYLKAHLGANCTFDAYEQEKGYFSVSVTTKKDGAK